MLTHAYVQSTLYLKATELSGGLVVAKWRFMTASKVATSSIDDASSVANRVAKYRSEQCEDGSGGMLTDARPINASEAGGSGVTSTEVSADMGTE